MVDYDKISEVANYLVKSKIIRGLSSNIDTFTNPEYYPSKNDLPEKVAQYFITMVAIDHRTSYKGKPYETILHGKLYHGADLLYRLGKIMYVNNPDFFDPKNLVKISVNDVRKWLNTNDAKIWDLNVRVMLLRDLGRKLVKLYDGSVMNLIRESKNMLKNIEGGFIDRLKVFRAYEDPVEKKPYLLVKFLERRGIFIPIDKENLQVPVDNHLVRIAFRLGIVKLSKDIIQRISYGKEFSWEEDVIIRLTVRKAYKILSEKANISPLILDDVLWNLGRTCCIKPLPRCLNWKETIPCPFYRVCEAFKGNIERSLSEHLFINTWYY